jgi:hypothetical protein
MKHSTEFQAVVDDAKTRVKEISVADTLERMKQGAELIDVREDNEYEAAHADGSTHMGRGVIERDIVRPFRRKKLS